MSNDTLGFLGAGHLASYTITALRRGGHSGRIIVSPRNAAVAARLAADHGCVVASSSQDVIDNAGTVVLSVRPHQLEAALDGLAFRPDQIVLSAVSGVTISQLRSIARMPETVVRFMPSSFIEAGDSLFPLYPANPAMERLLGATGRVVVFDSEDKFEMATLASCSYAWIYELLDALADWFTQAGWPPEVARDMAVRHVRGATTFALANPDKPLEEILAGIATEGTYTKAGLEHLRQADAFAPWRGALSLLQSRLGAGKRK